MCFKDKNHEHSHRDVKIFFCFIVDTKQEHVFGAGMQRTERRNTRNIIEKGG